MGKNKNVNRRSFLKSSKKWMLTGLIADPVVQLFKNICLGIEQQAMAQTVGESGRLIQFEFFGGVPGYYGWIPLKPNGPTDFIDPANPAVFNALDGNGNKQLLQVKQGEFYLPHLWSMTMPHSNGQWVPMSLLAENSLFVRGFDIETNNHPVAQLRQSGIALGKQNPLGLLADFSHKQFPLAAIINGADGRFVHSVKTSSTTIANPNADNPLETVFKPFMIEDQSLLFRSEKVDQLAKELAQSMGQYKNSFAKQQIDLAQSSMRSLFMQSFEGLQAEYEGLYSKYRNLISLSLGTRNMAGISDQVISVDAQNKDFHLRSDTNAPYSGNDLRDIINTNNTISRLASDCAITEYLISHNLSCSIFNSVGQVNAGFGNDAHNTGAMLQFYVFTHMVRAYSACVYELVQVLKAKNLFNQTIIQLSSDFSRCPREEGGISPGSDHAGNCSYTQIINGEIEGPSVTGNIYDIDTSRNQETYPGTYGSAAPVEGIGHAIQLGNVNVTLSNLLGIKPNTSDSGLLFKQNGKWKSIYSPVNIKRNG